MPDEGRGSKVRFAPIPGVVARLDVAAKPLISLPILFWRGTAL